MFDLACPVRVVYPHFCSQLTREVLGFIAKKLCPELIMVNHHFDHYMDISGKIMNIFREYDPNMCAAGCDEGYLKYAVEDVRARLTNNGVAVLRNIAEPIT